MASSVTELYSPLATPTRSSLRQPGGRTGSNSVRFFGIAHDDADDDHTSGVGPLHGRSAIAIKQAIFNKYFNEFTSYPLLLSNVSRQSTRGNSLAGSRASRSVRSGASTPSTRHDFNFRAASSAWTPISSTHVPSESPGPRWATGRQFPGFHGKAAAYGAGPLHVATRPVITDGSLADHLSAFETLLAKPWTSKEVQQAQIHGFFRRLVPHLGVEKLQGPAALLLARCARLHPPLLLPLLQRLSAVLPLLLNSPRRDVRQAGLCLLGLLWRAAGDGPSQLRSDLLAVPRLMEALAARADERSLDALWCVREMATDARGAVALEGCGALRALCRVLRHLAAAAAVRERAAAAAAAAAAGSEAGGEEESGHKDADADGGDGARRRQGQGKGAAEAAVTSAAGSPGPGVGPGAGGGVARGSKRLGVTEGGELVEQAAEGLLVAEALAACSAVHSAALLLCDEQKVPSKWATPERCRAPQRLVSLLLRIGSELDRAEAEAKEEREKEEKKEKEGGGGDSGQSAMAGASEGHGTAAGPKGGAKVPRRASGSGEEELDEEEDYTGDFEGSEVEEENGASGAGEEEDATGGGGGGTARSNGGDDDKAGGGGGSSGGGAAAQGSAEPRSEAATAAAAAPVPALKAQRQLLDALLRGLYGIAASGHCQKPQQVVQGALRDAGDAAVRRLAAALRGPRQDVPPDVTAQGSLHLTLSACTAATYLLWLLAAGEYSSSEGSELNMLRARMAKDAPPPTPRKGGGGGSSNSGGDGSGDGRYDGFGVVPAVANLLLLRLPGWRDPDLGDCVAAAGTTPPPPPAEDLVGGGGAAAPGGSTNGTGSGGSASGSGPTLGARYGSGVGGAAAASASGGSDRQLHRGLSAKSRGGGGGDEGDYNASPDARTVPRVAPPGGGGDDGDGEDDATVQRRLQPLRIGSTAGLLLTPRDNRAGPGGTASPQERYRRGDSSDDDVAAGGSGGSAGVRGGRGGAHGAGGAGGRADASGAAADGDGDVLGNTGDLDLSNVIDSSVELTGKEQLMRMIAGAGSALLKREGEEAGEPGAAEVPGEGEARHEGQRDGQLGAAAGSDGDDDGDGDDALELPDNGGSGGGGRAATAGATTPGRPALDGANRTAVRSPSPGGSDATSPGSGCTPLGAPLDRGVARGGGAAAASSTVGEAARLPPLAAARPSALLLPPESPPRRAPPPRPPLVPSVATWLGAVRCVRQCRPAGAAAAPPAAAAVQELQTNCVGLLSALALSASGCRAICGRPGLLSHVASLLELPDEFGGGGGDGDGDAKGDAAAAALHGSGQELRLQLLALLTNLSLHAEGATAIVAASPGSGGGGRSLPEALYCTAERATRLMSYSPTSWRAGGQLLESCFTVLTNLHRAHVDLGLSPDPATNDPRDSFRLAVEALRALLPASVGTADRTRLRAAAARMLDSAVAAYEGVGRSLAPPQGGGGGGSAAAKGSARRTAAAKTAAEEQRAVLWELVLLLTGGAAAASGGGGGSTAAATAERAARDGAGALWQLMASGAVHPEDIVADLEPPLVTLLGGARGGGGDPAALRLAALGLVSCLARAGAVARRMWTSPLLPAVLQTHALAANRVAAGKEAWAPVVEAVRGVCQALCRVCHWEDREAVMGPDKRVDRWGLTERVLSQLGCRLEFDRGEEGIVLVPAEQE